MVMSRFATRRNALPFDPRNYYHWVDTGIDTDEEAASGEAAIDCDADATTAIPAGSIIKINSELMSVTGTGTTITVTRTDATTHDTNADIYKRVNSCVLYLEGQQDAQSATIRDLSGNGNHGTITGATWVRNEKGLWVNSFDGNDDIIDCGTGQSMKPTQYLSVECWFETSDVTKNQGLVYRGTYAGAHGVYQLIFNTTHLRFSVNADVGAAGWAVGNLSNNTWYHVVGTYDQTLGSSNVALYVNGIVRNVGNYSTNLAADANKTYIGSYYVGTLNFLGNLALVRILNRTLSATEVAGIFQQERSLFGV